MIASRAPKREWESEDRLTVCEDVGELDTIERDRVDTEHAGDGMNGGMQLATGEVPPIAALRVESRPS
jgi:hypothetical protein